mmetsp:Transcript_56003/g.93306  ORF Transcript_56003/g.93306 Transcript_56003/m.93306 type:complete len:215 (-) Transcript_56003:295-939(-)
MIAWILIDTRLLIFKLILFPVTAGIIALRRLAAHFVRPIHRRLRSLLLVLGHQLLRRQDALAIRIIPILLLLLAVSFIQNALNLFGFVLTTAVLGIFHLHIIRVFALHHHVHLRLRLRLTLTVLAAIVALLGVAFLLFFVRFIRVGYLGCFVALVHLHIVCLLASVVETRAESHLAIHSQPHIPATTAETAAEEQKEHEQNPVRRLLVKRVRRG